MGRGGGGGCRCRCIRSKRAFYGYDGELVFMENHLSVDPLKGV